MASAVLVALVVVHAIGVVFTPIVLVTSSVVLAIRVQGAAVAVVGVGNLLDDNAAGHPDPDTNDGANPHSHCVDSVEFANFTSREGCDRAKVWGSFPPHF